ncbi:hypothetical protein ASC77_01125 [Nocardioides sp. Root1257]|uniref:hypothetical protein n=1 Tax=unclassified Nocardioides TaxID=2615069 RepID=UPI0006F76278|nr:MULTISPECIES: hypothetical protein [unclassified Nocardioides]KQW52941.1 hypothetical protein ASC77_01125 [Nocardioides sp. Root1257]KRC55629.1 hypothetical protein ASE24_01125 [Nocardioides sp. Root224]
MATPERRTAPGTPVVHSGAPVASGPVPVMAPLGWLLILVSGIGLILASWLLYGTTAEGMWAGYRDGVIGTTVLLCAMALNSSLPAKPFLGICGVAGILLILFAVFLDDATAVFVSELVAGIGILVGVGLYTSGRRD